MSCDWSVSMSVSLSGRIFIRINCKVKQTFWWDSVWTQHYYSVLLSLESLFITPHTHIPQPYVWGGGIIEACNGFPAKSFREGLILIQRWMSFTADLRCDNLTSPYTHTHRERIEDAAGRKTPVCERRFTESRSYICAIHLKTQFIQTFSPYLCLMSLQTLFHPRKTKGDLYSLMFKLFLIVQWK